MRQSLSEREKAGDFSAPLCFTHRGNGASIQFEMSPRHICWAFPISTSQNSRRWERIDRQNELNGAFFSLLFFFLFPMRKCNHEVVPAPISVLQLERSCDGRGTLATNLHLPQKTERKKGGGGAKTIKDVFLFPFEKTTRKNRCPYIFASIFQSVPSVFCCNFA